MPMMSNTQLARLQDRFAAMDKSRKNALAQMKDKKKTQLGLEMVETVGAGAAIGLARGYMEEADGTWNVPGIPGVDAEMALGLALQGAALFNLGKQYNSHLAAVGNGVMAHYTGQIFRKFAKTGKLTLIAGGGSEEGLPFVGSLGGRRVAADDLDAVLAGY